MTSLKSHPFKPLKALRQRWRTQSTCPTPTPKKSEQGLSILECLIAVAVLGLTVGLVLPPLVIASATRVQTRRAEQALQLAQGEIDRIRVLVERNQHTPARLPAVAPAGGSLEAVQPPGAAFNQLKTPASNCPPGITRYTNNAQIPSDRALLIDVDGDCNADFMMQTFRTQGSTTISERADQRRPSEFRMGVRVYSITAGRVDATRQRVQLGGNLTNLQTQQANLTLTSGEGNQLRRPLAVVYTRMSWGDRDSTLCEYQGDQRNQIESCQDTF
ncbi:type IV pilus modification PilV family protein [Egbenema bharatensis]|uniref:type IV pilus modification PilV family protein n=1 Tax=Egbenema bharatensis TaxID=3463334 RepID=UPI003A89DE30